MRILYRIEDSLIFDRPPGYDIHEYEIVRETDLTYFLAQRTGGFTYGRPLKQMRKKTKRPFAYETVEEAANAYAIRKFRHIEHCRAGLKAARTRFEKVKRDYGIEMEEPSDEWFE